MTPLHYVGDFLRELMLQVPLSVVRVLFLSLPLALLVWVMRLPRSETSPPGDSGSVTGNLKLWAGLALIIQIAIYIML